MRLDIQQGGEWLLPFARKKIKELHDELIRQNRTVGSRFVYVTSSETVFIRSQKLMQMAGVAPQFIDKIRITAGSIFAYALYSSIATAELRQFTYSAAGTPGVPPNPTTLTPMPDSSTAWNISYNFAKNKMSWIGTDTTGAVALYYVYGGTVIDSVASPAYGGRISAIAPDGAGWWISFRGNQDGGRSTRLNTTSAFSVMKRVQDIGTGVVSMSTDSFLWWDYYGPLITSVGLSAWDGAGGYEETTFFAPPDGGAPSLSQTFPAYISIDRNIAVITYSWVSADLGVVDDIHTLEISSRVLIIAVNSKYATLQTDGPDPGAFMTLQDLTFVANAENPGVAFSGLTEGSEFCLATAPGNIFADITPAGNTVVSMYNSVFSAGDFLERRKLYVNGLLVHDTGVVSAADSGMDIGNRVESATGLHFLFLDLSGGLFLYDAGTVIDLSSFYDPAVFAGGAVTSDGKYVVLFHDDGGAVYGVKILQGAAEIASRSGLRVPSIRPVVDYDDPAVFYGIELDALTAVSTQRKFKILVDPGTSAVSITAVGDVPLSPASVVVGGVEFTPTDATRFAMVPFSTIPNYQ